MATQSSFINYDPDPYPIISHGYLPQGYTTHPGYNFDYSHQTMPYTNSYHQMNNMHITPITYQARPPSVPPPPILAPPSPQNKPYSHSMHDITKPGGVIYSTHHAFINLNNGLTNIPSPEHHISDMDDANNNNNIINQNTYPSVYRKNSINNIINNNDSDNINNNNNNNNNGYNNTIADSLYSSPHHQQATSEHVRGLENICNLNECNNKNESVQSMYIFYLFILFKTILSKNNCQQKLLNNFFYSFCFN